MSKRLIWIDVRGKDRDDTVVLSLSSTDFDSLVVTPDQISGFKDISVRNRLVVFAKDTDGLKGVTDGLAILSDDLSTLEQAVKQGRDATLFVTIDSKTSMDHVLELAIKFGCIVIRLTDETNIPLELIICKLQGKDVRILKEVHSSEDALISFGILEKGTDGVLLSTSDPREVMLLYDGLKNEESIKMELVEAEVFEIKHVGMGNRGCVDTTSLMTTKEGMLVGSTSTGGILVCSETHYLPYMNLRPFRVNAGALHSYIWGQEHMAEYLTDLKAGSKVLCVDTGGNARIVTVGRIKMEIRPLLLIEAKHDGKNINVIVQDDWHVRVFGFDGKARNVTTLKQGDKLLAHIDNPSGRHVGIKVKEELIER
ncbi:3-dehydroquinate synthase [bacterium]|nr:3-dehydroquinate synthase [bacterium]